jgi:hypothetical protein
MKLFFAIDESSKKRKFSGFHAHAQAKTTKSAQKQKFSSHTQKLKKIIRAKN